MAEAAVGRSSAIIAIATAEKQALMKVTPLGVNRAWKDRAARTRPIRRLMNREYAGDPLAGGFCALARRRTVTARVSSGAGRVRSGRADPSGIDAPSDSF